MHQLRVLFLIIALMAGLFLYWQLPAILKATPSRYVARLPEPVQALGERGDGVAILPTVVAPANVTATNTFRPVVEATATPFPAVTSTQEPTNTPKPTPEASPTNTPEPTATNTPVPIPVSARMNGFVHQFQTWNNCGPATIAMALSYYDLDLDQTETAAFLKPDPEDRNVSPYQMGDYVNENTPYSAIARTNGSVKTIKRLVANGYPTIIELGIEPPGEYRWLGWYGHYLLIVAYDDESEHFWVYDSWFGTSEVPLQNATVEGRVLEYADIGEKWRQFNRNYIVLFREEEAAQVTEMIGEDMDDATMWENSLLQNQSELQQETDDAFLWFNLGRAYNALGQYKKAAEAFDQARAIGLPWRMLWYQFSLYETYYQSGRYEDILLLADTTLEDRPYFEESFYFKGLALAALGDTDAACQNLERAVEFNPNFRPASASLENGFHFEGGGRLLGD
jgi:tetratricopeptide (TPR) repeat protein